MSDWLDFLAMMDLVDWVEGIVSTFRYTDWNGAFQRGGIPGVFNEFLASVGGANAWTLSIQRNAGWSGIDAERLLARHGVRVWGRWFIEDNLLFCVKKRQARWAEYLLLRRGIPVTSGPFDPRNLQYAERYAPGSEPPHRRARPAPTAEEPDLIERFLSWLASED